MDNFVGKRLDSRYEIQELIGMGGMSMVYRAYDTVDDKTVAIKILKDEYKGNEDFIRRFQVEFRAIAVMSHPNIVKVYDVSFGAQLQYIVMEYIDGITLKEYITHRKVIPWNEAVHFTVQILHALQHAHSKGIVHRDMKPQNIMLLQDGTIRVTDFGIARFFKSDHYTKTDKAIGSVHYIAPEQVRGDQTDDRADIYSVGVMLYEMLTGALPFEGDTAVSVAIMQMQSEPKPLREVNAKVPEGIEEITLRAMRKNPGERFASAAEMLEAIETFRHNPSVHFGYRYDEAANLGQTKLVGAVPPPPSPRAEPEYDDEYDEFDEYSAVNRSKTAIRALTVFITFLVLLAVGTIVYMVVNARIQATQAKDVEVPQLTGMMVDAVKEKYKTFKWDIEAKYDASQPLNMVLSQDPEAGSKLIKENSTIKLVINSTATNTEVPRVRNYSEQEAINRLENKFFNYTISRINSTDLPKGSVIACSPQEGTQQEIGTTITLIVSDGPAAEKGTVPDVVGMSYDAAKAALEREGFTTQRASVAGTVDEGKVVNTDPLAGNNITKGSLVIIQVSDGSKQVTPLNIKVDLPEEYAEVEFTVYEDGKEIDRETIVPATATEKTLEIDPKGAKNNRKIVTVMLDGVKFETFTADFKTKEVSRTYLNTEYKIKQGPPDVEGDITALRSEAIDELNNYYDPEDYDEENLAQVREIVADAIRVIMDAETKSEIETQVSEAKIKINEVPTLDEPEPSPGGDEPSPGEDEPSPGEEDEPSPGEEDETGDPFFIPTSLRRRMSVVDLGSMFLY